MLPLQTLSRTFQGLMLATRRFGGGPGLSKQVLPEYLSKKWFVSLQRRSFSAKSNLRTATGRSVEAGAAPASHDIAAVLVRAVGKFVARLCAAYGGGLVLFLWCLLNCDRLGWVLILLLLLPSHTALFYRLALVVPAKHEGQLGFATRRSMKPRRATVCDNISAVLIGTVGK